MSGTGFRADGGDESGKRRSRPPISLYTLDNERLDTFFDLLSNSRRRHLLYYLLTVDVDVVELPAAVHAVYKYEAIGTKPVDLSPEDDVRVSLRQDHLPRLADAGILDYDPRHGTVRLTEHAELEEWVEYAQSKEFD